MSYDILLYPRTPGQDWDEVLSADEEETDDATLTDAAALEAGVSTFGRIEERLREALPLSLDSWVAEETGGDVYGELSSEETGLQVELFAGSAAVSFPYWEREDLELATFHEQVRQAVRIVAEETGFEAYDPQTGETFDGEFDDEAGRQAVRQLAADDADGPVSADGDPATGPGAAGAGAAGAGAAGAGSTAAAPAPAAADPRRDPAFLRRRGIIYVVLGVVLTIFGLTRLTAGDAGWLTLLVLAIGVLDLLGGLFMLSLSRRVTATDGTDASGTTEGTDATGATGTSDPR